MMPGTRALLRTQLSIAWALLDHHLQRLDEADLFWAPAPLHWTLHYTGGTWVPDWADIEPDPTPVPTAAWLTWHIGWWWSTALAHLTGAPIPAREQVGWPGDVASTTAWLRQIFHAWQEAVSGCDRLAEESAFPWPAGAGYTRADLCAWVNVELTKNAAELGQLLLLRRADPGSPHT